MLTSILEKIRSKPVINLSKGGTINLSKMEKLKKLEVRLNWEESKTKGVIYDLDASVLLLDANDRVLDNCGLIFYNQEVSQCSNIRHGGDNKKGGGEVIYFDVENISEQYQTPPFSKAVVVVNIFKDEAKNPERKNQNFGMVNKASCDLVNVESGKVFAHISLSEDTSEFDSVIFAEIYYANNEWSVRSLTQGYNGGLPELLKAYGVGYEYK